MFVPAGVEYECLNNVSKLRDQMSEVEERVCVTWATWSGCASNRAIRAPHFCVCPRDLDAGPREVVDFVCIVDNP